MHRACAAVSTLRLGALIALAPAPNCRCDDRSGSLWLLVAVVLLLLLLFAVLGDGTQATRLGDPGLWCRVVALAHLSARAKSVVTVSTSCVANFSNIFSSRTPWRKAVMMEASEIRGIVPRTLVKREINARRVSPGSCLTAWRWASTPCC
jgi:hypothetical protein